MSGMFPLAELLTPRIVGGSKLGEPFSAVVTESNPNGVWCAREGEDSRQALGPVRNPDRDVVHQTTTPVQGGAGGSVAGHYHTQERLPKGLPVLLVNSSSGLWVIAHGG